MKWLWKSLLLLGGVALFGWYISRIGVSSIFGAIQSLGIFAPLVLVPYLVVYHIDCIAWIQALGRTGVPFYTLLRIRWIGESLNSLVPSAYVGGEALKVVLLRARGISAEQGATAAVVSKSAQTVGQVVFIVLASLVFLKLAPEHPGLQTGIVVVAAAGIVAIISLFGVQKAGFFRISLGTLRLLQVRSRALEEKAGKLLELDRAIFGFYREHPRRFYASTFFYLSGWLLDTVEIMVVAGLLGVSISWEQAVVVEAFTGLAKALGMWIPGSVGVQESGIVLVGQMVGLPAPFCAAYAIIRRGRELIFAGGGLLLFYTLGKPVADGRPPADNRII